MKILPTRILFCLLTLCFFNGQSLAASSTYPDKPIKIVVPWPAGGLVDAAARLVSDKLQAELGQPVIVENKAGAGGALGADMVAKSAPDGYTLLLSTSALNMNVALGAKLPFNFTKDLEPIALVALAPSFLVVSSSSNIKTVKELIANAKANPGKSFYASAGQGTPAHLSAELFKTVMVLDIVHVPYKGGPPAMIDQIAGLIDFHFANASVALPQIKAGKVRALAVTSSNRFPTLPDVPTMVQAGVPNFEADQWLGIFAPKGTPSAIIEKLRLKIDSIVALNTVKENMILKGMNPAPAMKPEALQTYLNQDLNKWTGVVKVANIKLN
jgi:tripartite-type tricarboxylate transporter receptor subunit TctC